MAELKLPKRWAFVWRGPTKDGITQSLLGRFMSCRERFRLFVCDGLRTNEGYSHPIEYGNMWHLCEESEPGEWSTNLRYYASELCQRYPTEQEKIDSAWRCCEAQYPVYLDFWNGTADRMPARESLTREEVFSIPYELPSGDKVLLRGKYDGVDLVRQKGAAKYISLFENKTKGQIDERRMERQLKFDLQTMFYLTALRHDPKYKPPVREILYNVIRRPLSGGRGSIRKHKPTNKNPKGESDSEFYSRLAGIFREDPSYFFMRWRVQVTTAEIRIFETEFLQPILQSLVDWWRVISTDGVAEAHNLGLHWRSPFGHYNLLAEGGGTEVDNYLETGSMVGLQKVDNLFPELD